LLEGSSVQFIGTPSSATTTSIWITVMAKNINLVNAPGCNAKAVAQYVTSSLLVLAKK
jgi:phosphoglycerate dehydrogenase-like enzyme